MSIAQDILHFYKNMQGLDGGDLQTAIIDEDRHCAEDLDSDYEVTTLTYADGSCIVMSDDNISAIKGGIYD